MFSENRRKLLTGVAVVGAGLALAGCPAGTTGKIDPKVIDQINQAIVGTCSTAVVIAATTITAVVFANFPALAGLAALDPTAAQDVAKFICGLIPPLKDGRLEAAKTVLNGIEVEVHGWHVIGGKPVWF